MAGRDTKVPTDLDRQIGSRIRARRIAVSMTQVELGVRTGVSFQQVQKYESGSNRISVGRLHQIASALGVTIEDVMGSTDPADVRPGSQDASPEEARDLINAFLATDDPKLRRALLNLTRDLARSGRV